MQRLLTSLLILLFTCTISTGWSQLYYNGKVLTTANGLSDNRITSFYKDATGYIWMGTKNGLNKYNGFGFEIYKPGTKNSISNEIITSITGDKQGNIWVGTMNGLNRFNPHTNTWTNWLPDSLGTQSNTLHNFLIWDIKWDEAGLLWIACDVKEFTSYNPVTRQFDYYDWPGFVQSISGTLTQPGYHAIQSFIQKNKEEFWLASNKGLVHLNTSTRKFTYIGGNYYADVVDIQYDKDNQQVWLSLEGGQVFRYTEHSGRYEELVPEKEPYPSVYLPNKKEKECWIASEQGLLKANTETSRLRLHRNIPSLGFSLAPGGVTTAYMDDAGIGWIGTPNGVFMQDLNTSSSAFLPLIEIPDKDGTNRMGGVFFDEAADLYYVCSADPAGLFVLSGKTGSITSIRKDARGAALPPCFAVKKINNQLWLITRDQLYRIKPDQSLQLFSTPLDASFPIYRDLEMDKDSLLWITSFNKGVILYDTRKEVFSQLTMKGAERLSTAGTSLAFDSIGQKMWLASYGNYLYEYSFRNKTLVPYYEKDGLLKYASLNLVHDIELDMEGRLWAASNAGGLYRYNPGNSYAAAFSQFDMRNGLSHNQFISIAKGEDSLLWLLSETGISYIHTNRPALEHTVQNVQSISSYGSDPRYPHPIFYNKLNKELLVAAAGGLLFYYPQSSVNNASFPIIVKKDSGSLHSFSFDALYYGLQRVHFEYQLEGLADTWTKTDGGNPIFFQNLSHGDYHFKVRATDQDGQLLATGNTVSFTISPPFWREPWFLLMLLAVAVWILFKLIEPLQQKVKDEKILNQFATSLYGKTSIDDIFWDIAVNCIRLLDFEDCVIYQIDTNRNVLVQRAAAGPKSPHISREIINHLEIPVGKGIVGTVAKTGKAERIGNTSRDNRYVLDDQRRYSEITIPIWVDGQLFGIIDSEHSQKHFFRERHSRLLKNIAQICGERISKYLTEERLRSKISRDLHDEMGSTLTSINILSKVAMARDEERSEVLEFLRKIKDHSGNMMESMSDIIWAINPANDSLEKVLIKMKEFAAEMLEPAGINYYFDNRDFAKQALLNLEERKDLYLVFKEAINNIVKYSQASEVTILLRFDKKALSLTIIDNGIGFDTTAPGTGNGIGNMKSRAAAMGAAFHIESIPGTGTSIFLKKTIT